MKLQDTERIRDAHHNRVIDSDNGTGIAA